MGSVDVGKGGATGMARSGGTCCVCECVYESYNVCFLFVEY